MERPRPAFRTGIRGKLEEHGAKGRRVRSLQRKLEQNAEARKELLAREKQLRELTRKQPPAADKPGG